MQRLARPFSLAVILLLANMVWGAQLAGSSSAATRTSPAQQAISLVQSGRCSEALPLLRKSAPQLADKNLKLRVGLATVRCALALDERDSALEALRWLNREFPHDPDVLYVSTHAYSDLSTRESLDLARGAPGSYQAHELNAEAFEVQGKWEEAAKEYRWILKHNPELPGTHFRLGRLLLSKPNPGTNMVEDARKEMNAELKIDPSNAGAEYVLGELARQSQQWDEAIRHFSRAAKLDASFGDAFLGWGASLIASKKFADAIPPLETAVKLEPENPATHYNLAVAYRRAGRKTESEKEFAIHRQMTHEAGGEGSTAAAPP